MPVPGGGFEQCTNAQACVAAGCLLVGANNVVQAAKGRLSASSLSGLSCQPMGRPVLVW